MIKTYWIILILLGFIALSSSFKKKEVPGFKNLKILPKNITEKEMDSIMHNFSYSLGVKCGFCHVHDLEKDSWNMASDGLPEKLITRKMMIMTKGINFKYFSDEKSKKNQQAVQTITCYTCHKGETIPVSSVDLKEENRD